jgi:uncharacterized protein YbaR (Trm112 family)
MGMFDIVNFNCPYCKDELEAQSKAGECNMIEYNHMQVPEEIASDLKNESILCSQCGSAFKITGIIPDVTLYLVDKKEDM